MLAPSPQYVKRVLVVDDNPAIGRMLTLILQKDGHHVVVVTSGADAVEQLRKDPVDLVFSELSIGGRMDWLEVYAYLRRKSSSVRFVLGTRSAGLEHAESTSGVEVLAKPYHLADLRRIIGAPFAVHANPG